MKSQYERKMIGYTFTFSIHVHVRVHVNLHQFHQFQIIFMMHVDHQRPISLTWPGLDISSVTLTTHAHVRMPVHVNVHAPAHDRAHFLHWYRTDCYSISPCTKSNTTMMHVSLFRYNSTGIKPRVGLPHEHQAEGSLDVALGAVSAKLDKK